MFEPGPFLDQIHRSGFAVVEGVLDAPFIERAKRSLEHALMEEDRYHRNFEHPDRGMVLLCSLYGGPFLEVLENPRLIEPFEAILGPGCIVYAYTSSSMPPMETNYSNRIHNDCPRLIPGYVTNVGATILLDDFNEENGATFYLPGSHRRSVVPGEQEFFCDAKRLLASAGSVFFFNARLFHAGGWNRTLRWRHALTINMCRPYMKQRIDIPRAMAHQALTGVSEKVLQKLGFRSQVPASYDEYYSPLAKRPYRQPVE